MDSNAELQPQLKKLNSSLLRLKLLDALGSGDSVKLDAILEDVKSSDCLQDPAIAGVCSLLLHYAVQVAPISIVEYIVSKRLIGDINSTDADGNTPLHLACQSSRHDVIQYLMSLPTINDCILNKQMKQPIEVVTDMSTVQLVTDARTKFVEQKANELRTAFETRNFKKLEKLLSNPRVKELLDLNGTDPVTGDTVLLEFIKKNDQEMVKFILQNGGDPFKRNVSGKLPVDYATNSAMKKLLKESSKDQSMIDPGSAAPASGPPTYKGFLKKWTNFASGYKLRWFILDTECRLSYYKSPSDIHNSCRGMINLTNAYIKLDSSETSKFEIIIRNGNNSTPVKWHLKANHVTETNRWVWALQNAIRYSKDQRAKLLVQQQPQPPLKEKVSRNRESFDSARNNNTQNIGFSHKTHQRNPSATSNVSLSSMSDAEEASITNRLSSNTTNGIANTASAKKLPKSPRIKSIKKENFGLPNINENSRLQIPDVGSAQSSIRDDSSGIVGYDSTDDFNEDRYSEGDDEENDDDDANDFDIDSNTDSMAAKASTLNTELNVIHNQLLMEIQAFKDYLKHSAGDESVDVSSLTQVCGTILTSVETLNSRYFTTLKHRDAKILRSFQRQKEVSRLWEDSIKILEFDLIDRERKIVDLEDKLKTVKRALKGGAETGGIQISAPAKEAEVQKILDESDSDDDEFFDAQEAGRSDVPTPENEIDREPSSQASTALPAYMATSSAVAGIGPSNVSSDETSSITTKVETAKAPEDWQEASIPLVSEKQKAKYEQLLDEGLFVGYEDPIRTKLPLDDKRPKISLWGVLKSMVGKDMTKITLPVSFNECTSLLQRVAEDMEYTDLIDQAAHSDDSALRMVYVAGFAASEYASTIGRIAKPFNPLLGETYEYARPDKKYRFFVEQVSHHPPISAAYAESPYWDYYGESFVKSRFMGRSFDINPLGMWFLNVRPDHGVIDKFGKKVPEELYTWKKVTSSVIGIIIGNPSVDNFGDMHLKNHVTGDSLILHFKPRGWRASSAYELKGDVVDKNGKPCYSIGGHWNSKIFARKLNPDGNPPGEPFLIWQAAPRPEKMAFNLTTFASSLNALQPHLIPYLPPTDTRFRPDQRAMEEGDYDVAPGEKQRVEDKQRAAQKYRTEKGIQYKPHFFVKKRHPVTGDEYWEFNHEYWFLRKDKKLKELGDIF
ncbi:unnamed protein product [Kuraishia capsulata CBS 1993]|uniref:PH domain-containing protein n=1 Tax=Kuraishia capsulata CBS 1993 TaxID=1382522 RepID=W6MIC9_9ASCO|nr:uncharacterized protein KUCA_T00002180001 [Kuraishia capsulata CBS 1993]CDK26209.1 unnamed protein product [Kuraishia capsulata CBS 1993]